MLRHGRGLGLVLLYLYRRMHKISLHRALAVTRSCHCLLVFCVFSKWLQQWNKHTTSEKCDLTQYLLAKQYSVAAFHQEISTMNGLKVMKKDCEQNYWVCLFKVAKQNAQWRKRLASQKCNWIERPAIRGNLFVMYICSATFNWTNSIA